MKNETSAEKITMSLFPPKGDGAKPRHEGGESEASPLTVIELLSEMDGANMESDLPIGLMMAFVGLKGHCAPCEPKKTALSDGWGSNAAWWKAALSSAHGRGSSNMGMGSFYKRPPSIAEMVSSCWQSKALLAQVGDEASLIQEGMVSTAAEARQFISGERRAAAIFDRLMGPLSVAEDVQELAEIVANMAINDPKLLNRSGARLIGALDFVALCGSVEQALRLANGPAGKGHLLAAASLVSDAEDAQREVALALGALAEAVELEDAAQPLAASRAPGIKRL